MKFVEGLLWIRSVRGVLWMRSMESSTVGEVC